MSDNFPTPPSTPLSRTGEDARDEGPEPPLLKDPVDLGRAAQDAMERGVDVGSPLGAARPNICGLASTRFFLGLL